MLYGDNIRSERSFVTLSFDGAWPQPDSSAIWEHFVVQGPLSEISRPRKLRLASMEPGAET